MSDLTTIIDTNPISFELKKRMTLRDFPLQGGLDLYILFGGGIGNIVQTMQAVIAMADYLAANTRCSHRLHAYLTRRSFRIFSRYFRSLGIFITIEEYPEDIDIRLLEVNDLSEMDHHLQDTKSTYIILYAFPNPLRVEHTSYINYYEHLWAMWGLPGYYQSQIKAPSLSYMESLSVNPQVKAYVDALPESYICYFYSANSGDGKKRWPSSNAMETFRLIYENAGIKTVAIGRKLSIMENKVIQPDDWLDDEVFIIKLSSKRFRKMTLDDFLYLQKNSMCTLSIDTGPAHLCGLFSLPCITLWGPTNPSYYHQQSNTNIRTSSCPSCHATAMYNLCDNNQCMQDIDGALVAELLLKKTNPT